MKQVVFQEGSLLLNLPVVNKSGENKQYTEGEHSPTPGQYFEMFSSLTTESFYVLDLSQNQFCYVKPDDLFLCGYSVEEALKEGCDFYRKIVHPEDLPLWTEMREAALLYPSEEDVQQVKQLAKQYQIEQYKLNSVYTGDNIRFFEENVFLTKEDILSTSISIEDFFANQSINIYDFGKINIMSNGDVYANLNHPVLGNIYINSIYEILQKEIDVGKSWLRVRNQSPCNNCIYQWLCPSPSDYEIAIGRPNLCHIK